MNFLMLMLSSVPGLKEANSIDIVSSVVGLPLRDAITHLGLKGDYWLGGGAGDHILQYCVMSDENSNSFYLWVDVSRTPLPNRFLDKERDRTLERIFESIQNSKVTYVSVINTTDYLPSSGNCKVPPLIQFSGRMVSEVLSSVGIEDERMVVVYNIFVNRYVLRVAAKSGDVYELQVNPTIDLKAKANRKVKPKHLMNKTVLLLRVYSGIHSRLKGQLPALDGSRR